MSFQLFQLSFASNSPLIFAGFADYLPTIVDMEEKSGKIPSIQGP